MTTERLYDLLDELVVDASPVDAVDLAWDGAQRIRQRRRLAVTGSVAAAVIALAVGVAVLDGPDPSSGPPVTTPSQAPTTDPSPSAPERPDTTYAGIDVVWSPTVAEEADLPWYAGASPLPRTIDLAADAPGISGGDRALAVFAIYRNERSPCSSGCAVARGTSRSLDVSRLEPVRDVDGNAAALLPTDGGLAPDGRHVFFAQNSSLEVYEFATDTWTIIDTPDWEAEGARWLDAETIWLPSGETFGVDGRSTGRSDVDWVFGELAEDALGYGPVKTTSGGFAQSQRLAGPVQGGDLANPEAIGVTRGGQQSALAFPDLDRAKGCCPVVGWLDGDTVVYESERPAARLAGRHARGDPGFRGLRRARRRLLGDAHRLTHCLHSLGSSAKHEAGTLVMRVTTTPGTGPGS